MGRGRGRLRQGALAALTGAVAVAALALFAFVVRDLPAYDIGPRIPWWALALAFAVTELFVVHAHVRGSAHSLSMSELPLILGLLLATPQDLVIAQVAGPALVLAADARALADEARLQPRPVRAHRVPGRRSRCTRSPRCPARSGRRCGSRRSPPSAASALTGATLVFAAIALAEGVIPSRRLALLMGADLLVAMTNTSVGLAGATLVAQDPRAGWLLLAPACILLLAYRAYLSERTKHESLEFLYGVARSLSRAPDIETALVDLLRRTRAAFRVEAAEIVLFSGGDTPLRTALTRGRRGAHGADRARRSPRRCARAWAGSRRRWCDGEDATGELAPLPGAARDLAGARRARCRVRRG